MFNVTIRILNALHRRLKREVQHEQERHNDADEPYVYIPVVANKQNRY